ncbi:MAG: hypothetical protein ACTSV2_03460 [Candidatus Thorarchaeota archaeon]
MRRIILSITLITLMLLVPPSALDTTSHSPEPTSNLPLTPNNYLESASAQGDDGVATSFMSREISGQSISVMNSFVNTAHHNGTLDLAPYLIPGWTLYNVTITLDNFTASSEQESIGSDSDATYPVRIQEYSAPYRYTNLTQGFYNQVHNGSLVNVSLLYQSPSYDPSNQGYAFVTVVSDYSDYSSNMTNYVSLSNVGTTSTWKTVSNLANLTSNTEYFVSIDGSLLHESAGVYPWIRWLSQAGAGDYTTRRFNTDGDTWGSDLVYEAFLNYTYIPWNQTSNTALNFQASEIEMRGNATSVTGNSWSWTNSDNITLIEFDSNQSVYINHNLTLWYKRNVSYQSVWDIPDPLGNTNWNLTIAPIFPVVSGTLSNFVNLTRMSDWTATGLYNGTSTSDYDNYTVIQNTIRCSSMTNGTWTMMFTAHNYLTSIMSLDTVNILDNLAITSLIQDGSSINATTGSTNLTIWKDTTRIDTVASNETVVNGATQVSWDINADTSTNGTYQIEVYWTNGTEAGYLTKSFTVYLPTSFDAESYSIDAHTENTFSIKVDFNDTFTGIGLDSTYAQVEYSFNGEANVSLDDVHSNGTWTKTISTVGRNPGSYIIDVYGTGFAIENKSLTITLNLLHETQPLTVQWMSGNSITYPESTMLQVTYRNATAPFANITNAEVNVTIGTTTWNLMWDVATETYQILFNGSDVDPGFAIHNLEIKAWRAGYEAQTDPTQTLTIAIEPTIGDIIWNSPYLNNITYIETTILNINYTMSNGTAIEGATVNVTIASTTWDLKWNATSQMYYLIFNGTDVDPGFGEHTLDIKAWKYGYIGYTPPDTLDIRRVPTSVDVTWQSPHLNDITFIEYTMLYINYTMSNGTAIESATVNVTIGSTTWDLKWNVTSQMYYLIFNGTDSDPGFGTHTVDIKAWKFGYIGYMPSETLDIQMEPTSIDVIWSSPHINDITFIEYTVLCINYTMSNGTAIEGATVNVTIDTTTWNLIWSATNQTYCITFNGTDADPGFAIHTLNIEAWKYGYIEQTPIETLTIQKEPTTVDVNWLSYTLTWTESTTLRFNFSDSYSALIPLADQTLIYINGTEYTLLGGANGTYWIIIDNSFDLGHHVVVANISKIGYDFVVTSGITFDINEEITTMTLTWEPANVTLPYIYSLNLTVEYNFDSQDVPASATVNVTINGDTYPLSYSAGSWYVSIPGNSIGIGVFSATTQAWLYGYEARINVTSNVNITLAANSFIVYWEPSDYTMTYVEQLNITVIYTYENAPVPGATVKLILNGTRIYDLVPGGDNMWHLLLDADIIGLGTWNATILANETGYDTGKETQFLTISVDPCTATPNWSDLTLFYSRQADLNVTLLDSTGSPILNAVVNATYIGVNYTMDHLGGGVYRFLVNGTNGIGPDAITVRTFLYGFENRTVNVDYEIVETPTSYSVTTLIGGFSTTTVYYDGWIRYSIYLEDVDSIPLHMVVLNITISGQEFSMQSYGNGTFYYNLTASDFPLGPQPVLLDTELTGYEFTFSAIPLIIETVPTRIEITSVPSTMYFNSTVQIEIQFINNHTNLRVNPDSVQMMWADSTITYTELGVGFYRITVSTFGIDITSHDLVIQFNLANHTTSSQTWDITVRAVNTWLVNEFTSYEEYENETLRLSIWYSDSDHDVPIHWAIVNVTVDGDTYSMVYLGEGEYFIQIYLADREPGYYLLTFEAEAEGCAFNETSIQFNILEKTLYVLEFEIGSAIQGATLGVTVTVSHLDTDMDVSGISVTVYVLMTDENGDTVLLNDSGVTSYLGVTQVNFDLPIGIQEIDVWASFDGSESEWPITAEAQTLAVNPPSGLFETLVQFLTTPIGLFILFALVGIIAVRTYYVKKVKPRKHAGVANLEKQLSSFNDLRTLQHFMAIYLDRGTCVFYHPFREARIQPDLISGFITAITSVYGEIKGDGVRGTLEEIHYQGLRLNSYSGKYLIGVLIIEGDMTSLLKERMEFMIEMFEQQYESDLHDWMGVVDCFDPGWIVSNLNSTFNYHWILPHTISDAIKAEGIEKKVLKIIHSKIGKDKEFLFEDYILKCAKALKKSEAEILDIFLAMEDSGIFVPISTHTVLQRQGMGIADSDDDEETDIDDTETESIEITEEAQDTVSESETIEATVEEVVEEAPAEPETDSADKFVDDIETLLSEDTKKNDND